MWPAMPPLTVRQATRAQRSPRWEPGPHSKPKISFACSSRLGAFTWCAARDGISSAGSVVQSHGRPAAHISIHEAIACLEIQRPAFRWNPPIKTLAVDERAGN